MWCGSQRLSQQMNYGRVPDVGRISKLFTMLNNKENLLGRLQVLGLSHDEAKIFLELTRAPTTHLKLSELTGINRTKVYRLANQLEERGLVAKRVDDRGVALVATDPAKLEIELLTQEEELRRKRKALHATLPEL